MTKFIGQNLPALLGSMRPVFDNYYDLLADYANGALPYHEFAARVRRRNEGANEDNDWEDSGY